MQFCCKENREKIPKIQICLTPTISLSSYLFVDKIGQGGLSELSCNLITGIIAKSFSPLSKQLVFSHNEMQFVN